MSDILQIFTGNPLTTFIGKKIEAATRPELEVDDWALNLEICDIINENDDDAKDAVRAIKKRLQQIEQDRNFTITNRTLTVLETCVSNCSKRFHVHVMTKDFIQDLVKLIGPKSNPPIDLQERVLRLIERWAEAFRSQPDLGGVVSVYNELKSKGVTFPPPDPNSNVPIQTPQRSVAPQLNIRTERSSNQQQQGQPLQPAGPVVLEGEGYNKISQDLAVVQSSVDMFNEIMCMLEAKPDDESDWRLAADLNITCRQMKDRIVDLIERVANEDLTIEFLKLNDDLNNIFIKYDRLVKNRSKLSTQTAPAGPQTSSSDTSFARPASTSGSRQSEPASAKIDNELSLIDFNAEESIGGDKTKPEVLTIDDPFDSSKVAAVLSAPSSSNNQKQLDLATESLSKLSMQNKETKSTSNNKTGSGLPEEISSVREQDFAEIENWLKTDSGRADLASLTGDFTSVEPSSLPNSEFENFLANRANAGSATQQTSKPSQKPEPSV